MLLAIDIGNTNILIGVLKSISDFPLIERVTTNLKKTESEYLLLLNQIFNFHNFKKENIDKAIISSVVPEITNKIENAIKKLFSIDNVIVLDNLKSNYNIKINYANKSEIGIDRLVNAEAVNKLYKLPAAIIDTGTTVTICFLSENGIYEGGVIMPGINISALSLHKYTAKLPLVDINKPEHFIGKTTIEGIKSGIYYSIVGGLKHIISELNKKYKNLNVIITGGYSDILKNDSSFIDVFDSNLTLKGLLILSDIN